MVRQSEQSCHSGDRFARRYPSFMSHTKLEISLPILCAIGFLGAGCSSEADGRLTEMDQPFSTGLAGEPVHEDITAAALSFLTPETMLAVTAANVETDVQFVLANAYHFDDCNFSGASEAVASEEAAAVAALNPANDPLTSDVTAFAAFGHALHTAQDFYAHSNWVELGQTALVDDALTAWSTLNPYTAVDATGIVVVQGTPPSGTAVWRNRGAPYPTNAIVQVQKKSTHALGVMSGTVDYEAGNFCPPQIAMTHDALNKDHSTYRVAQHNVAVDLGTQQTAHEWCRLLTMTRAAWGDGGDQRLFGWVGDAATASQCGDATNLSVDVTSATPNPVTVGQPLTIQVAYSNAGPATAYGTSVKVTLAPGAVTQSATSDRGTCSITSAGDVDCYVGEVAPGNGTIQINALAMVAGDQSVQADISAHVPDTNASDDSDAMTVSIAEPVVIR
jgi:hypothetical protein